MIPVLGRNTCSSRSRGDAESNGVRRAVIRAMKTTIAALCMTAAMALTPAFAQTAGQDMKNAGSDVKGAAKDTGKATKHTASKVKHKTKHTVNKASSKVADKTAGH